MSAYMTISHFYLEIWDLNETFLSIFVLSQSLTNHTQLESRAKWLTLLFFNEFDAYHFYVSGIYCNRRSFDKHVTMDYSIYWGLFESLFVGMGVGG